MLLAIYFLNIMYLFINIHQMVQKYIVMNYKNKNAFL